MSTCLVSNIRQQGRHQQNRHQQNRSLGLESVPLNHYLRDAEEFQPTIVRSF